MPAVPEECINYQASIDCQWTLNFNCPGQPASGLDTYKGPADADGSHGYYCCCEKELWKYVIMPVTTPKSTTSGPNVHWKNGFTLEGVPHYIYHQKYPLMRWFEDNSMCPLDEVGGFPAWIGWKSIMAAGAAITTPEHGIAGNRTLKV